MIASRYPGRGFTMIELVVVILILGIVFVFAANLMFGPVAGALDTSRRSRLVARAEAALARMSREIRLALPNSVRAHPSGTSIEFLRTASGGSYRAEPDPGATPGDPLDFNAASDTFDVTGGLPRSGAIAAGGGRLADCLAGISDCVVIYNTGQPGADAWAGDNLAAVSSVITAAGNVKIGFDNSGDSPGWSFPFRSPGKRFFIVDTPVAYVCDPATGRIWHVSEYRIEPAQVADPAGAHRLLVDKVSSCGFSYDPGTATRAGLVTLRITLTEEGESVHLLRQIHIPNAP